MNGDQANSRPDPTSHSLLAETLLRPVDVDEWSQVRALLAAALASGAGYPANGVEARAIRDMVFSPEYTDALLEQHLWVAEWQGHLLGVCGWLAADDNGHAARIVSLGISPLFAHLGLGRLLLENAERRAATAGYQSVTTRVPSESATFYLEQDYELTAFGTQNLTPTVQIQVAYLRKRIAPLSHADAETGARATDTRGGIMNRSARVETLDS